MTNIRVRHDAPMEVTVTAGRKPLSKEIVPAKLVGAHLTEQAHIYGASFHEGTWFGRDGDRLRQVVRVRLTDDTFLLKDGEECRCPDCLKTNPVRSTNAAPEEQE